MAIRVIILVVFGILSLAWIGFLIWLLSLIIRALLKYLKTEDVRKEKAVVTKSLGEKLKNYRTSCMMTQEFVAEQIGVSRHGPVIIGLN